MRRRPPSADAASNAAPKSPEQVNAVDVHGPDGLHGGCDHRHDERNDQDQFEDKVLHFKILPQIAGLGGRADLRQKPEALWPLCERSCYPTPTTNAVIGTPGTGASTFWLRLRTTAVLEATLWTIPPWHMERNHPLVGPGHGLLGAKLDCLPRRRDGVGVPAAKDVTGWLREMKRRDRRFRRGSLALHLPHF